MDTPGTSRNDVICPAGPAASSDVLAYRDWTLPKFCNESLLADGNYLHLLSVCNPAPGIDTIASQRPSLHTALRTC
ncbi:hypothetical protein Y1Q_0013706 [Alligator mississippiensis]|uniref:Uncharacterized protein n=1 Tax=Alligator mississippiensis TaxID=8496 RepID=A0A151NW47_ALLMI|nr:hypothetical protein Y1Q_0013706 [Alligator mississippiensis]